MSHDYRAQVEVTLPELDDTEDDGFRDRVKKVWCLDLARGGWRDIVDIPYAWNIHEVTSIEHVHGVTRIAAHAVEEQRDSHGADLDFDVVRAACLLHDVGKYYGYVDFMDDDRLDNPDPEYASGEIPHSLSGYALAHEVGCPLTVQRAIPHFIGETPTRMLEAELVKSANSAPSDAITQAATGISL